MSIENTLERIAVALETIATGGSLPKPVELSKVVRSKPAKEATSSSKAKDTTKPAGKPSKPAASSTDKGGPEIADVRKALGALQKVTSPDDARALLKEVGKSPTMSKLAEDMYQAVIDAALEAADAAS